jgi:hypothetical protein
LNKSKATVLLSRNANPTKHPGHWALVINITEMYSGKEKLFSSRLLTNNAYLIQKQGRGGM